MTPTTEIAAAIFDMDGLIIDSEPLWRRAEIRVFASVGLKLTDDLCRQTMGLRIDEAVQYWYQRSPWRGRSVADVVAAILDEVEEEIRTRGVVLPGVAQAIAHLAGHGLPLAVASSSPRRLIDCVLDKLALADNFAVVCSAMDEEAGKPHPAVYLSAARHLGVEPARCVALEDSIAGIRSARAAGMIIVYVPDATAPPAQEPVGADLTLASLADLSLAAIRAAVSGRRDRAD